MQVDRLLRPRAHPIGSDSREIASLHSQCVHASIGGYSDGVNDGGRPGVSDVSLIDQDDLKVFSRWGQLGWQTQDPEAHRLGSVQPDGSYFAGDDVYTWVLQIKSNTLLGFSREWKGHVTLFRRLSKTKQAAEAAC
tara:strand:- start:442 stop:849 length:408 start_codon:yes stop_codon:yes gene_type:complete